MNRLTSIVFILGCVYSPVNSAPFSASLQEKVQQSGEQAFWIDPATNLMWAARDNGRDVSWKDAVKYCRNLRLMAHADWHLASLGELERIYDEGLNAPGRAGPPDKDRPFTWHIKGYIFLTGNQWNSTRLADDRGRASGYASRFDSNEGRVFNGDELYFKTNKRALCVRDTK